MPPRSARRPPSATTIDALFRSTKPGAARPGKTKGAPPTSGFPTRAHRRRSTRLTTRARAGANVAIEDDDTETIDDDDAVERDARELKTFDLTSKFGPCCGLTRIERWDRARAGANVAIEDDDAETIDDDDAVERDARELKTFDLTSKFGPCCGLTRIERWDRARALGLDPPKRVLEILHRRGEASARWRECVWHGRV
jgi:DNA polymerase delta subunit 4